ncbi:50S ribosomal protein L4 [soil metagenome]
MPTSVLTLEDAKSNNLSVVEQPGKGHQAVHDMVVAMQANRRSGTACTKTRGEVSASNAKPWRQKGTGRARAGRKSSPIWTGGGVVFGPRPRSYAKTVNRSTRKLAFRTALTSRIVDGDVLVTDTFAIADGKTKAFVAALTEIGTLQKVLVIAPTFDEKTYLAGRNYKGALLMTADEVNVEHILYHQKIVITQDAFEILAKRTAK